MYYETVKKLFKTKQPCQELLEAILYLYPSLSPTVFIARFPNWFLEIHKTIRVCTLIANTSMGLWATHSFDFLFLRTALGVNDFYHPLHSSLVALGHRQVKSSAQVKRVAGAPLKYKLEQSATSVHALTHDAGPMVAKQQKGAQHFVRTAGNSRRV